MSLWLWANSGQGLPSQPPLLTSWTGGLWGLLNHA